MCQIRHNLFTFPIGVKEEYSVFLNRLIKNRQTSFLRESNQVFNPFVRIKD